MSKPAASRSRNYALCLFPAIAAIAATLLALSPTRREAATSASSPSFASPEKTIAATTPQLLASFGALPLAFEQNQGQTDPHVDFLARTSAYTLFLTKHEAVFSFRPKPSESAANARGRSPEFRVRHQANSPDSQKDSGAVRMHLAGANTEAQVTAAGRLPGISNYFLGNNPANWRTNVPQFSRIAYKNVYPGVDLAFYGVQSKMEFDFIVAPGSTPAPIAFTFSGAGEISTDASGNLVVASAGGDVVLHKPVAYQLNDGARQPVDAHFILKANHEVSFDLGSYDRSRVLLIDPSVSVTYATYLGGSGEDDGYGIAFDSSGNTYVTGQTKSADFPGTVAANYKGGFDVFVTKLSANGSSILYSTYVGGTGDDSGNALAVDALDEAIVAGGTSSLDFPTTSGAFQKNFGGSLDAFLLKLDASGAVSYCTYLGGTGTDVASGVAADATYAYVVGSTSSTDFPTQSAKQPALAGANNGFVTKIPHGGGTPLYSTYLGAGTGDLATAVAVKSGQAYVTGQAENPTFPTTTGVFQTMCGKDGTCNGGIPDAFVTVYNAAGSAYVYSTFLGGSNQDEGLGIAVDSAGNAYVTGLTSSSGDFPLKAAFQHIYGGGTTDAFVAEFNPTGTALVYSTLLGGNQNDVATSIAVDSSGDAYVTGQTGSTNFPVTNPTIQGTLAGGNDAFVTEISPGGIALAFSTYLGGSLNENTNASSTSALGALAVDPGGANVYVTGNTLSTDFPKVSAKQSANGGGIDAFVVKYSLPTGPDFAIGATIPAGVGPGSSGSSTVTLTALRGYSSPVNLSCSVTGGGSPPPACSASSFTPNPQTPATAGATSVLTITTSGGAAAMFRPAKFSYALWLPVVGMALVWMGFSSAGSRRKKLMGFLMMAMVIAALFLMPACSSKGGGGGGNCSGCTPAGNYTVTITGTGTDASNTTHSTQIILKVN